MNKVNLPEAFTRAIMEAAHALRRQNIQSARLHIADAIALRMDAPQPHNLLGILNEIEGDDLSARRHYRAAYALDPTYKPACRNLERLVMFEWGTQSRAFDYGERPEVPNHKNDAPSANAPV